MELFKRIELSILNQKTTYILLHGNSYMVEQQFSEHLI